MKKIMYCILVNISICDLYRTVRLLLLFVVSIAIFGCASIPSRLGGGPEDKEPPTVIRTFPENRSVSFKESTIEIEFSEYVNRGSVLQNIVIQPRTKQEYSWKGTILKIHFIEPLRDSTTYSLTIGNDVMDVNQNKATAPISLAFSTGSTIDSAKIYGKIIGAFPDGVQIFAYKLGSEDTCNPESRFPDYNRRIASDGSFSFESIANGTYRLFAIKDEIGNNLFDIGNDMFSIAPLDITAKHFVTDSVVFKICPADYFIRAKIIDVKGVSNQEIEVQFSKEVLIGTSSSSNFSIIDSSTSEPMNILSINKSKHSQKELTIVVDKPFVENRKYGISMNNNSKHFKDIHNFEVPTQDSILYFSSRNSLFPNKNAIASVSKKDSSTNISLSDSLEILLEQPISPTGTVSYITQKNEKISLLTNPSIRNYFSIPFTTFANNQWNNVTVEIKDPVTKFDTIVRLSYQTVDNRNFGKIKGTIERKNTEIPLLFKLNSTKRNGKNYQFFVTESTFSFENLEEGSYIMDIIVDTDKNGIFSCGNVDPLQYCEKVIKHPTIFEIKPRWSIDKVLIKIPE
ncbi:MAG: Ig-like domain-containing protein [Candidatus Kapabacteria bacterium]|nr:Ig-like domain-containing protein [Candidatus Kapabacteria bacterium]